MLYNQSQKKGQEKLKRQQQKQKVQKTFLILIVKRIKETMMTKQ